MTQLLGNLLIAVAIAALAGVGFMAHQTTAQMQQQELHTAIRSTCAQAYRYTAEVADGVTVSYPMEVEYQQCLEAAGLK